MKSEQTGRLLLPAYAGSHIKCGYITSRAERRAPGRYILFARRGGIYGYRRPDRSRSFMQIRESSDGVCVCVCVFRADRAGTERAKIGLDRFLDPGCHSETAKLSETHALTRSSRDLRRAKSGGGDAFAAQTCNATRPSSNSRPECVKRAGSPIINVGDVHRVDFRARPPPRNSLNHAGKCSDVFCKLLRGDQRDINQR